MNRGPIVLTIDEAEVYGSTCLISSRRQARTRTQWPQSCESAFRISSQTCERMLKGPASLAEPGPCLFERRCVKACHTPPKARRVPMNDRISPSPSSSTTQSLQASFISSNASAEARPCCTTTAAYSDFFTISRFSAPHT
ncbi:hypothetical protein PsYK624_000350 [Phanerochaete sordida]|uniref:Uncharacterized protein n=1 Tax=Phanerochaete sordida TaxID=48140 RepID=A0A9P3FVQ1_9APHY|nr:hypothetical protein PsYK624_000350 [Phanerochaete sordida]